MAAHRRWRTLSLLAAACGPAAAFLTPSSSASRARSNSLVLLSGGDQSGNDDFASENQNFYNDFDDAEISPSSSFSYQPPPMPRPSISAATDPSFFESLSLRREQLRKSYRELLNQWTTGSAKTFAAFTINEEFYKEQEARAQNGAGPPSLFGQNEATDEEGLPFDWVRRVAIGSYPRVVCGSAHGSVYVADVEAKRVLGVARDVHSSRHNENVDGLDEKLRKHLYGDYDGGGVLAVAMHGNNLVASAGREGGVKLFKLAEDELSFVGDVPSLKRPLPGVTPMLVTCLEFDSLGRLYAGGQDGFLRMVTFTSSSDYGEVIRATVISSPHHERLRDQPPSPILSLKVCEELDMVATAHANGNVCIYSTNPEGGDEDSSLLGVWNPFSDTNDACHARSLTFVSHGSDGSGDGEEKDAEEAGEDSSWSIVVGGGNGVIWMQEIHPGHVSLSSGDEGPKKGNNGMNDTSPKPLFKQNSMQQIKPSHQGPVLSLASRPGGILISAGHDGMLRVTKVHPTPRALYGLGGYKVWIGNVCVDDEGKRLLSDGRDDVVVVHDFSREEEEPSL